MMSSTTIRSDVFLGWSADTMVDNDTMIDNHMTVDNNRMVDNDMMVDNKQYSHQGLSVCNIFFIISSRFLGIILTFFRHFTQNFYKFYPDSLQQFFLKISRNFSSFLQIFSKLFLQSPKISSNFLKFPRHLFLFSFLTLQYLSDS